MTAVSRLDPDQVVTLPGGLIESDGRRLDTATLRPLTGFEEEWLAAHPGVPSAVAVTQLLGSCVVRLGDEPGSPDRMRQLLVGDRDYLMLQLRRLTLGEAISAVMDCPACGARMDVDFSIGSIPIEGEPQTSPSFEVAIGERAFRVRLPTGADQEAVLGLDGEPAARMLLDRCLVDVDEAALSAEEAAAVTGAMEQRAPRIELELDLICPDCGDPFLAPFDTTAFILQEFRLGGRQLLREVHVLASLYHWSERDILALRQDRRRAYLALLSDMVRPA
jgi:hypothetical protein